MIHELKIQAETTTVIHKSFPVKEGQRIRRVIIEGAPQLDNDGESEKFWISHKELGSSPSPHVGGLVFTDKRKYNLSTNGAVMYNARKEYNLYDYPITNAVDNKLWFGVYNDSGAAVKYRVLIDVRE